MDFLRGRSILLRAVVTTLLAAPVLAGCGSDVPTRAEAGESARTPEARAARKTARKDVDRTLAPYGGLRPRLVPLATARLDICHVGQENGLWPHDGFRVRCTLTEHRYLAVEGELVAALRAADSASSGASRVESNLETALRYYEQDGKTEDGRQLPKPSLKYDLVETDVNGTGRWLVVEWHTADEFRPEPFDCTLRWHIAYCETDAVDLNALWAGPIRGRQHLMIVSTSKMYYEVPWSD